MTMDDAVPPCDRSAFSLPEGLHYLNCSFMSPLPRVVREAGLRGLERESVPTGLAAGDFFRDSDRVRAAFARLVGGDEPGRVALVPAVSYGAAVVARNLRLEPGRTVVVAGEQFPSHVYPWRALAARGGGEVVTVARPDPAPGGGWRSTSGPWMERILEAIDGRTALVALPHAHWSDGTLFDLEAAGARAREVGAALVVDGTQTLGAHPFDVKRIRPDAVLCSGYKWLLGPYGTGVAWLGERFGDALPVEETWMGREGSEEFAGLVAYRDEYRPDASRLDAGGHATFILTPMLAEALELLGAWGTEAVARRCADLTARIARGAAELGCSVEEDAGRCSNIVGLGLPPGWDADRLRARLSEASVHVSRRGAALRVSPHVYNGPEDVDALLSVLEAEARA
ncbi:MAG TPA: aminotransferase class V-fold PLP-dependent enzyme [Gemmatimonadota bacterium]|nr:aminotransferase class V-fold PLP-dependent enzyme [Gemmatimonadota bacterium]